MSRFTLVQHIKTPTHHYRLRFGRPVETVHVPANYTIHVFSPYQVFGYVRWFRNKYGTRSWQLYICQSVRSGRVSLIPGVRPGAEILLRARGKTAVRRTLSSLNILEKTYTVSLENIPASFWRKAQNSTSIRQPFPNYAPII